MCFCIAFVDYLKSDSRQVAGVVSCVQAVLRGKPACIAEATLGATAVEETRLKERERE